MKRHSLYLISILIALMFILTACSIPNYFISAQMLEKGNASFDKDDFQQSISYYDKAIKANPYNATALCNKSAALNSMERYEEALEAAEKALEIAPKEEMLYLNKGDAQNNLGLYEEALRSLDKAIEINSELIDAYISKGTSYYYLEQYDEAISVFDKAIKLDADFEDAYLWKAQVFMVEKEYEKALSICRDIITRNKSSAGYYKMAQVYQDMNKSDEALASIDKAIAADVKNQEYYIEKLSMQYEQKDYEGCIDFGLKTLKLFPREPDINWYIADCYSAQLLHDKAAAHYVAELDVDPQNDQVAAYAGWEYFYMQDYSSAQKYADLSNKLYKENDEAASLLEELKKTKLPEGERIVNFVQNNYLYFNEISGFSTLSKEFVKDKNLTTAEISEFIDSIRSKNDVFTYVISGAEYDYMLKEDLTSQVSVTMLNEDTYYAEIDAFTPSTGFAFGKELANIKNTEMKNLIIDLRGNFGGMIDSSNHILDYLLPDCTTSYTIDRNGYLDSYYSDDKQVRFKKILVLVDEDSASSAELLALGLKKYLKNVVIIGRPTFGKGVGQNVYEDKKKKYMIFLVSFYWNVREENIAGTRIYPDVNIRSRTEKAYEKEIRKQLNMK